MKTITRTMTKMEVSQLNEQAKHLVLKFVKKEKQTEKYFWPRELKIARSLINKHGFEALQFLVLGFELNSLAFLVTEKGNKIAEDAKITLDKITPKKNLDKFDKTDYVRVTEKKKTLKERILEE